MAGFVVSNLIGLVQRILVSRAFGTGQDLDAFYAALRIPDLLFNLVAGGALASAFLPSFAGRLTQGDRPGAWRLASSMLTLVTAIVAGLAVVAGWLAPWVVRYVLAPGFDPQQSALAANLLRTLLVTAVIFGASGLVMSVLQAHQHFLLPALAPSLYGVGWILGAVVFAPRWGIHGLAIGVIVGACLHLAVQLPGLRGRGGSLRPRWALDDPAVRTVLRLMGPRLIGVGVVQVNFFVNTILASGQPEGSLAALALAFAVMIVPQAAIAQALAIAALPTFSAQAAEGRWDDLRRSIAETLRGVVFLSLPASLGLISLRRPIVALLFERGAFDSRSTDLVAWALLWYAAGLVGHALVEVLSRAFYALQDTRTPVLVGAGAMSLNVFLSLAGTRAFLAAGWPPHGALALANSLATAIESAILLGIIGRRVPGMDVRRLLAAFGATGVAAAAMVAALLGWNLLAESAGVAVVALGGVATGFAVFWLAALLLRTPEARELPGRLLGR
jgi:putative peptidoglycan lipid II flippase